jgi:CheY-like chemotaxis protein
MFAESAQGDGRRMVLVVEDEILQRMDAALMFEEAGLPVVQAANADEAIAILENRDDIGVVVTDIQMPGSMDGLMLARSVNERWPPLDVIIVSGNAREATSGKLPAGVPFFNKPYNPEAVVRAVTALLGSRGKKALN